MHLLPTFTMNSIFINFIDSTVFFIVTDFYVLFSSSCKLIISRCAYCSNWIACLNGTVVFAHFASDTADIAQFISL